MWILLYGLHHIIKAIVQPDGSHTSYQRIYCYIVSLVICPRINPDCSNNAPSNPIGIRHDVFALTREGMQQSANAGHLRVTRATVNHIIWRHAATGALVPGKSTGAPRKTTPHQDHVFLMKILQDRFISARALTVRMRNLYGMRNGWKTINKQLFSHGYRAYRPKRKPLFEVGTEVTEPIGSMSSSVMSPDSNLTQWMAGLGYVVYLWTLSAKVPGL